MLWRMNRFSVPPLAGMTRDLAAVAGGRQAPDLVIAGARVLSTYSERILPARELWLRRGRIAAVRPAGECKFRDAPRYDAQNGIVAPGLVDPHLHIESSMMTACAYAEPALLNGTTTIFCDSHEIGNVLGVAGSRNDARGRPAGPAFHLPHGSEHRPRHRLPTSKPPEVTSPPTPSAASSTAGRKRSHSAKRWTTCRSRRATSAATPSSPPRSGEAARSAATSTGGSSSPVTRPAASRIRTRPSTATSPTISSKRGSGFSCEAARRRPPGTALPQAIRALTELGAVSKRFCVCTDDRDADDLFAFGLDWVVSQAVAAGLRPEQAWSLGSLHPATRYGMDGEIGGLGGGRRADLVLLDDDMEVHNTWYGGELVVERRKVTPLLEAALAKPYRYPAPAYQTVRCAENPVAAPSETLRAVRRQRHPRGDARHRHPARTAGNHPARRRRRVGRHPGDGRPLLPGGGGALRQDGRGGPRPPPETLAWSNGAVASSVGHDSHNLVVAGTNERDMQAAVAAIRAAQGGVCVVENGQVIAMVELPIAGLLSDKRATHHRRGNHRA